MREVELQKEEREVSNLNELVQYAVYDSKVGVYRKPVFFHNDREALRSFRALVNDGESEFSKWAEDFSLWRFARFDQVHGENASEVPKCLIKAMELKEEKNG